MRSYSSGYIARPILILATDTYVDHLSFAKSADHLIISERIYENKLKVYLLLLLKISSPIHLWIKHAVHRPHLLQEDLAKYCYLNKPDKSY